MSKQNVYDNQTFFDGYKKIRESEENANDLFEIPALLSLLPDLKGKTVLDLGCGFGEHCKLFVEMGARAVVGVDLSQKMLEIAKKENAHPQIAYINMAIEDISCLKQKFDVVVSSLAFHYVEDFEGVVKSVYKLLKRGGMLVFSEEHPLVTCHTKGERWTKDGDGNKLYLNLSNYGVEGERQTEWLIDGLKIYHRSFSTVINTLIDSGFCIERIIEPLPSKEILDKYPKYKKLFHKPDFLLVKSKKR